jgi:hypothetical protein
MFLNLGAGSSFENGERIDENRRVGEQLRGLLQLGQRGAGMNRALQNRLPFEVGLRRQTRQVVIGPGGIEHRCR